MRLRACDAMAKPGTAKRTRPARYGPEEEIKVYQHRAKAMTGDYWVVGDGKVGRRYM